MAVKPRRDAFLPGNPTALTLAIASVLASHGSNAQESASKIADLGAQTVTGTRVRRIDSETSSPVFTIDREAIEKTGAVTLGHVLQQTPVVAGAATNPQVNNGGGTGASTVSLRGVGAERTLVLLDGRRYISDSGTGVDVNSIPINLIERVEILKDGASAIYGSDAIGGVVNFITRRNFDGFEFSGLAGESSRSDGGLASMQLTLGATTERSHFMLGALYDQRDQIGSADRDYSKEPFAMYNGVQYVAGSSRTDTGFYRIPRTLAATFLDLTDPACNGFDDRPNSVALTRTREASGTALTDYHCFVGDGPDNDLYNYQQVNVVVTPQERYGFFVQGEHDISAALDAFLQASYHYTEANYRLAATAFDGRPFADNVAASADSIYNPFGIEIPDWGFRTVLAGNRVGYNESNRFQITGGLHGTLPGEWRWEGAYTWGQQRRDRESNGFLYLPALTDALGASFRDAQGQPVCGTPPAPIAGCTPINFFSLPTTPEEAAEATVAINALSPNLHSATKQDLAVAAITADGRLFDLPAGPVGAAVGLEYRHESLSDEPDFLEQNALVSDIGVAASHGAFSVREAYAEVSIPLLADRPFAESLEIDLGVRYSDYSSFGETTNGKYGLEWRPGGGLLVRGTYSDVFRAPTVSDLFTGFVTFFDDFFDPCIGLTQATVDSNPNAALACVNVPRDGSFAPTEDLVRATFGGNPGLQPETGNVLTYGVAWTPEFATRLYVEVDAWQIEIDRTIAEGLRAQGVAENCFDFGLLCEQIARAANGEATQILDQRINIGTLTTEGTDFAVQYSFPETSFGKFRARLDATYLIRWDAEVLAGIPESVEHEAGQFSDAGFLGLGHFARWRGLGSIDWNLAGFSAGLRARYVGNVTEDSFDGCLLFRPDPETCANGIPSREVGDQITFDLQGGWLSPGGVEVTLGVDNATDEAPPLIYSGLNATTDMRTYDGVGRFYYLRLAFRG